VVAFHSLYSVEIIRLISVNYSEDISELSEEAAGNERNFYIFLNVAQDCSDEDLKNAYHRLALIWHPDRHTGEDARAHATAKFAKLTHIYEILSNPTKRKLYNLYGEKGLTSGLEIASHLRTYEELKQEYQRQARLRNERLLHAKLGLAGILQATVSAEQFLRPWLHADSRHIVRVRGLNTDTKQDRPPVSLESAMLSERVDVALAPKYTASLQAYVVAQRGGRGAAVLSLGARRDFSSRAWAKATVQARPPRQLP
jgi:curved DNA-binding protein CbpA